MEILLYKSTGILMRISNDKFQVAILIYISYSNWQYISIGLGNGLVQNRRQAITWTNADPVHQLIYAGKMYSSSKLMEPAQHERNWQDLTHIIVILVEKYISKLKYYISSMA